MSLRHEATRRRIIEVAWRQVRRRGLASLSLRELSGELGMRAPSLYTYFASKSEIYDSMFEEGWLTCIERLGRLAPTDDVGHSLRIMAEGFISFACDDPTRYQLMCQRVVPGFVPTGDAYAVSVRFMTQTVEYFAQMGITDQRDVDLWIAMITGLIDQQMSNDPGGDRWLRLVDDAAEMYLAHTQRGAHAQ